jgi:hypothetical protein
MKKKKKILTSKFFFPKKNKKKKFFLKKFLIGFEKKNQKPKTFKSFKKNKNKIQQFGRNYNRIMCGTSESIP